MKVRIFPSVAKGVVTAPPSKSMAHRMLIAAALAEGVSKIDNISLCDDVLATADCLRALGASVEFSESCATVRGFDPLKAKPAGELYCRESGSTLRFLIPIAWLSGEAVSFRGAARLFERPMDVYSRLAEELSLGFSHTGRGIELSGAFRAKEITIRGDVSSQFISGLLFALCALGKDSRIHITENIESRSYIDLTVSALRLFGAVIEWSNERTLLISGGRLRPANISVEGDYSATAFTEAFGLFGGEVKVSGLSDESLQGDRVYRDYYKRLSEGCPTLSIKDCPDLGPILFAVAAAKSGATFLDTARLRIKESDRAYAMSQELSKLGVRVEISDNSVTVHPAQIRMPTVAVESHNDHRIVMSMAVLLSIVGGEINGAEAVKKSYPEFFRDIEGLGIKIKYL